jgi:death-on-curing protein
VSSLTRCTPTRSGNTAAWLAAAYGFALVSSHPYRDGNKRFGFLAIATILGINGYEFTGTDEDIVRAMLGLSSGQISEDALASWNRDRMIPLK